MKSIRRNVFETNSSSTHSLTIKGNVESKEKLQVGKIYSYTPQGLRYDEEDVSKVYKTEYEKLCVVTELLLCEFRSIRLAYYNKEDALYCRNNSDNPYEFYDKYIFAMFKESTEFDALKIVLKSHNIQYRVNQKLVGLGISKKDARPIAYEGITLPFYIITEFDNKKFANIYDMIENLIFNPKYAIVYSCYWC